MPQAYSNPARENDPMALPDVEYWEDRVWMLDCPTCGEHEVPWSVAVGPIAWEDVRCSCGAKPDSLGGISDANGEQKRAWFYWSCFPGCLPDSDPIGPFATEAECIADFTSEAR